MAIITSIKTGNWEDAATWDNGVPSATDIVNINTGHTVTISSDVHNYQPGEVHVKGILNIAEGGRLIIGQESPRIYGTFVFYGGSLVKSTGNGSLCFTMGNFITSETSADNRAKFSCHMTSQTEDTYKRTGTCYVNVSYADFYGNNEQTTGMSIYFQWRVTSLTTTGIVSGDGNEFNVNYCTFSNLKGTRNLDGTENGVIGLRFGYSGWTGTGKFYCNVQNSDFRNIEGLYVQGTTSAESRNWIVKGNTFYTPDENVSTKKYLFNANNITKIMHENNVYVDTICSGTGVTGNWGNTTNSTALLEHRNILNIVTSGGDGAYYTTNTNVTCYDCYSYFTETSYNPHVIGIDNLYGIITENAKADEANHFMSPKIAENCIVIGSGDLFNYVGTFSDINPSIKNNTFIASRGNYSINSMLLAENSSFSNVNTTLQNNLLYNLNGYASPYPYARWVGVGPATQLPIDISYNLSYPASTSTEGNGWYADEYSNTATNPDTNISVDPLFIDATRNLPSATQKHFGYTGDITGNNIAIPYLLTNGYDDSGETPTQNVNIKTEYMQRFNEVLNWVKEGLTPTNMSLATAGADGTFIGAIAPKDTSTVVLSLIGPEEIKVGSPAIYTLALDNTINEDLNAVVSFAIEEKNVNIPAGELSATTSYTPLSTEHITVSIKSVSIPTINIDETHSSIEVDIIEDINYINFNGKRLNVGIAEAPTDGQIYARQNRKWTNISGSGGGTSVHGALNGRNENDQHTISSITGLDNRLISIETAQSSLERNVSTISSSLHQDILDSYIHSIAYPIDDTAYTAGNTWITFNNKIYRCITDTIWTGVIDSAWQIEFMTIPEIHAYVAQKIQELEEQSFPLQMRPDANYGVYETKAEFPLTDNVPGYLCMATNDGANSGIYIWGIDYENPENFIWQTFVVVQPMTQDTFQVTFNGTTTSIKTTMNNIKTYVDESILAETTLRKSQYDALTSQLTALETSALTVSGTINATVFRGTQDEYDQDPNRELYYQAMIIEG